MKDVAQHDRPREKLERLGAAALGDNELLALVLGYWLSTTFELPRLKLYYLVGGALGLWLLSLAAAMRPARRASLVSPAIATRTV